MSKNKKSWSEKLNGKAAQRWGGKLVTLTEIRQKLARKHHTQVACPLTSGIFSRIAAEAAEEQRVQGNKNLMVKNYEKFLIFD